MSDQPRFMSRRALLRAAGIAPLVLLGVGKLPPATKRKLDDYVKKNIPAGKRVRYTEVCSRLWELFLAGCGEEMEIEPDVDEMALALSGTPLKDNLAKFPTSGDDHDTLACAALCGVYAREEAILKGTAITKEVFASAWGKTHTLMMELIEKAKKKKPEDYPIKVSGFAC